MRDSLQRRPRVRPTNFVVGTPVVLAPHSIRGIVVDLLLDAAGYQISYAVVAFDTGHGRPLVYQPIRWNLLRRVGSEFVVNAAAEAIETGVLAAMPLSYGGNARSEEDLFPTPQSVRVH
jgi:hypothetical protein